MEDFILFIDTTFDFAAGVWHVIAAHWLLLLAWASFVLISLFSLVFGIVHQKNS